MSDVLLIDNSAWVRLTHPSLEAGRIAHVAEMLEAGQVAVSLPFLLEAGYSARNAKDHAELLAELLALPYFAIDDRVERAALDAQAQLARHGHHRLPPVDLLIAALADRHQLGVLHYDGDYDTITQLGGLQFDSIWLADRGTL